MERLEYQRVWLFYFPEIWVLKKRYFRGIPGHWKGLPLDFPSFRAPAGFSALFEHSQGTEIRKKIHKKQCVGLLVSSTTRPALFCCPANSNRAFSVCTLRSMAGYNGITGTAKKGTRSFVRFAEYTSCRECGRMRIRARALKIVIKEAL